MSGLCASSGNLLLGQSFSGYDREGALTVFRSRRDNPCESRATILTLYDLGNSVCCQKVRITMRAKGLDWESVKVDLFKAEQYAPRYLKLNPRGIVPTPARASPDYELTSNLPVDVMLELIDHETLVADDAFHQIADGDDADHLLAVHHRQMSEAFFGHQRHAFFD